MNMKLSQKIVREVGKHEEIGYEKKVPFRDITHYYPKDTEIDIDHIMNDVLMLDLDY